MAVVAPGSSFVLSSSKFKKSSWSDIWASGCNFAGSNAEKISEAVTLSAAVEDESIEYRAVLRVAAGSLFWVVVDESWFWNEDINKKVNVKV